MKPKVTKYTKPVLKVKRIKLMQFLRMGDPLGEFERLFLAGDYGMVGAVFAACFLPGTQIVLADNTTREIQKIKVGDMVATYNVRKEILEKERVAQVLIHPDTQEGYLIINGYLKVTFNHHFLVNGKEWQRADTLKVGDSLVNSSGKKVVVQSIQKVLLNGTLTTYNLELEGQNHNYFAEDLLVHNNIKAS